jgi:Domain of unknown function (DUF4129)
VSLAVLVVAAAGVTGTIHFGRPRWVPHFNLTRGRRAPLIHHAAAAPQHRLKPSHVAMSFPWGTVVAWIVVGLLVVALALLLWRWWTGRPSRASTERHGTAVAAVSQVPAVPEPEPDAPALLTGLELALRVLDEQRDPADAIVRAWLGLQEAAQESGIVRQPAETPTEFTSRIMSRAIADDRPVRTLLRLYLRTRFGDHPVTDNDVAAVRAALEELVAAWPAPPVSAAGTVSR